MPGTNPDTPTSALDDHPDEVGGSRLVGVDASGAPIYYDHADQTAYDGYEGDDGWTVGEERESGHIADIVSRIGEVTGWDALSEYGKENRDS